MTEYVILNINATAGNRTVALVMINYPREVESITYDISAYDGNHSAQSTVIIIGFDAIPTTSNVNQCGTACLVFVILAAITAIFLLPLLVFCLAARKHLKHLSKTLQDDPISLKVNLKVGSHNGRYYKLQNLCTFMNALP